MSSASCLLASRDMEAPIKWHSDKARLIEREPEGEKEREGTQGSDSSSRSEFMTVVKAKGEAGLAVELGLDKHHPSRP